jgi:hypothetical protein
MPLVCRPGSSHVYQNEQFSMIEAGEAGADAADADLRATGDADRRRRVHLRDGKVVEFWDGSTDQYTLDELIG